MTTISFALHRKLAGGLDPRGFHAVNIGLHSIATVLVLLASLQIFSTLCITTANYNSTAATSVQQSAATESQLDAAGTSPGGFTNKVQRGGKKGKAKGKGRKLEFGKKLLRTGTIDNDGLLFGVTEAVGRLYSAFSIATLDTLVSYSKRTRTCAHVYVRTMHTHSHVRTRRDTPPPPPTHPHTSNTYTFVHTLHALSLVALP